MNKTKALPLAIIVAFGMSNTYAASNQTQSQTENTQKTQNIVSADNTNQTSTETKPSDTSNQAPATLPAAGNDQTSASGLSGMNWDLNGVKFNLHGFMSTGMSISDNAANYNIPGHGNVNQDANFSTPSLFGLQLNTEITDKLSFMTQIVADGDDTNGNTAYQPTVNWMYAQYQATPNIAVRAGRFQIPLYMYSQEIEVGYNYPYTYLPNEIYRIIPFYSMNGVNLYMQTNLGDSDWNLSFQPFFGESSWDYDATLMPATITLAPGVSTTITNQSMSFKGNKLFGGDLTLSNTIFKIHVAYAQAAVENTTTLQGNAASVKDQTGRFYSAGAELNYNHIWASSEYAHRELNAPYASLSAYYASLGYHVEKFMPYVTYAKLWTTNWNDLTNYNNASTSSAVNVTEVAQGQKSVTLGLNYYYNANLLLKGSWTYIMPTQGGYGLFQSQPGSNVNLFTVSANLIF